MNTHLEPRRGGSRVSAPAGVLVLSSDFEPVYANELALQVLAFPSAPADVHCLHEHIGARLRGAGIAMAGNGHDPHPRTLLSGRRLYVCRTFPLGASWNGARAAVAVLLERSPEASVDVACVAAEFGLTPREQETVGYLVEGLTTKEIAQRMGISPNTVKVFLRLAMVKVGVTTRSGIIGKLVKRRAKPYG